MQILDQFKRVFKPKTRPDTFRESTASIKDRWSSYPSAGLTPQSLASILKQADLGDVSRQSELFEEMEEKDPHLSAELLKRKNAVNSLDFDILPYEEGTRTSVSKAKGRPAKSDKVVDFCKDVIFSMSGFEDSLFDLLDAIGKGFAMSWIKWEIVEGKAVVTDLEWVHQKRLSFVKDFAPALITQGNLYGEEIPAFQAIYHRHKARSGYDTRAGLLRVCTWMYLFKNYSLKDWIVFAEIFGIPLRLGKYEQGASKEDKDALVAAIQALGSDAAGIISKSTEIEFVEAAKKGGSSDNVYDALAGFCNREMSKAIVGATLTTEVGSTGSYAASKTHNEVRLDLVKSDCWSLANTLRMQLLRPLVGFNFGWEVPAPWFRFDLQEPEDLQLLSEVYKNVIEFGQPVSAEHVSDRFGIPMPEEGESVLTPAKVAGPSPMKRRAAKTAQDRFSRASAAKDSDNALIVAGQGESGNFSADQEEIEHLAEMSVKEAVEAMRALDAPVREMIAGASSLEEVRDKILQLYAGMNGEDLEQTLADALATAALHGLTAKINRKSRQD